MAGDPVDSLLMSLIEKEIPDGRNALIESHHNLADLSAYCKDNYINSHDKTKALQETKEYASQSLASVAYQIHSLAVNILQMMDQQTIQLQKMQSNANNTSLLVDIHKEKVARREIGVLTSSKNFSRSHKVVPPAQAEKLKKYKREEIDYTILDNIGHGIKGEFKDDASSHHRFSPSSSSGSLKENNSTSSMQSSSQGSLHASLYKSNSSDRKGAFGSTMPPPPRPPVAPVAPFKVRTASMSSGGPMAPSAHMAPPISSSIIPVTSPLGDAYNSIMPPPPFNMPAPDYDYDMDHKNLPLPPPPLPLDNDLYQVPSNNMPATPLDDLPPPPCVDGFYDDTYPDGGNIYESVPTNLLPSPPPPSMTLDGQIIPESFEEKVVAIYDYQKLRDDELELTEGDVIYVIKKNEDGWFEGIKDGIQGLFPGNYVTTFVC